MEPETAYLAELASRLRSVLGAELVGMYVGGSYALGDYERERSDLDVATVTRRRTDRRKGAEIVAAARHEALPCPARGLELVLYPLDVATAGTVEPGFDVNVNTGRGLEFRADFEPVEGEQHWFAIDRSVLAVKGISILGPPAPTVFRSAPAEKLVPLLAETLRWYLRADLLGEDAVLNACRALLYAREGTWFSKRSAGEWAQAELVTADLAAPRAFLEKAIAELESR